MSDVRIYPIPGVAIADPPGVAPKPDSSRLFLVEDNSGTLTAYRVDDQGRRVVLPVSAMDVNIFTGTPAASQVAVFSSSNTITGTGNLLVTSPSAALVAGTETNFINLNLAQAATWPTGLLPTERCVLVQAPTIGFVGASQINDAITFAINGVPILGPNATFLRSTALYIGTPTATTTSGAAAIRLVGGPGPAIVIRDATDSVEVAIGADASAIFFNTPLGQTVAFRVAGAPVFQITGSGTLASNPNAQSSGTGALFTLAAAVNTGGAIPYFVITGAASTGQTASTEINFINFNMGQSVTWAAGALTTQRCLFIQAPSISVGANTITTAATVAINAAPAAFGGTTITNPLTFWVQGGGTRLDDLLVASGTSTQITVAPPSLGTPGGNGWKISFGASQGIGQGSQQVAYLGSGAWHSFYLVLPNNNASATVPDTAAAFSVGSNGVIYPLVAAAGAPNVGQLWNDSTQQTLVTFLGQSTANGLKAFSEWGVYEQTAQVAITGTSATTWFGTAVAGTTKTIPANWWTVGKTVRLTASGTLTTNATATTVILVIGAGGVATTGPTVTVPASASSQIWFLEATITCITTGAAGTASVQLTWTTGAGTTLNWFYGISLATGGFLGSFNTTAAAALTLTTQFNNSQTLNVNYMCAEQLF